MIFPKGIFEDLVPSDPPLPKYINPIVRERAERIEDPLLRRSYLWANAIAVAFSQSSVSHPERFTHLSFGLVSINPEILKKTEFGEIAKRNFVFGAYALAKPIEQKPGTQKVSLIEFEPFPMPLIITYGEMEEHGVPPHPHTGSGACWIENAGTYRNWKKGILTCRHTLEYFHLGQTITLHPSDKYNSPTSGVLADIDECTIDAAIVEIKRDTWPQNLSPLIICSPLPPGLQAYFQGRNSKVYGTVLRVSQDETYFGNLFGQRIVTDFYGKPGDSGSLLLGGDLCEGMGIFMGTIPDGIGGKDGIFQDLNQVARYFNLNLYN
ncbi:MAG TPA: hypothetical protein VMW91_08390 [Desulfosporosinus sp.]|nr:hypothetical protein [Desulfosporosinus sp.]